MIFNRERMKKFTFGKVDYYGRGRRINRITVDVGLYYNEDGKPVFHVCGYIWNGRGTDCVCCGQCLDEIAKFVHQPVFRKIYRYWKLYHLNDLHAGTREQEEYLMKNRKSSNDYDKDCECLKKAGLLTVQLDGKPYTYGEAWVYWPIPEKDLNEIKNLLEEKKGAKA